MSHDEEIVFDDVKFREPERRCRPDRDRRWACLAYELPGPIDLPIYLDRMTADAIERHALRDTSVELGGILLGKECLDEETGLPFVSITKSLEAKHYENTQASFTYTHDSWEEITRERDRLHPDLDIVGWYHTHPDFGIFLSSHDQFIHRHFFAQPLQVAYVVDPIRQTRGFFQWRDGGLDQVRGFYLMADRGDRVALARLVNDLENFPNADGGGGGGTLSPRLEAELIAMLTRPAPQYASAADRAQTAALFSLIGSLVGMLIVAAGFFLYSMHAEVVEQSAAIRDMKLANEGALHRQRLAFDTLLNAGGKSSADFASQFDKTLQERDEAQLEVDRLKTREGALSDQLRRLTADHSDLKKELNEARVIVQRYKEETKDSPNLLGRIDTLESLLSQKGREIVTLEETLGAATDKDKAAALMRKYSRTWYAAVVGWGVGLLMTLGVLALLAQPRGAPESPAEPHVEPPPTHRIT